MRKGDKVTAVIDGLLVSRVTSVDALVKGALWLTRRAMHGVSEAWCVLLNEEGTRWVRGHVTEHDEAGAALLAAAALVNAKPPRRAQPLEDRAQRFIKGEVSEAEFKNNLDLFDEDISNGYC